MTPRKRKTLALATPMDRTRLAGATDITRLAGAPNLDGIQAFGALLDFKLHALALVEGAVAVGHDGREMHEYILAGGALDEAISLGTVEPLYNSLLFHAVSPQIPLRFVYEMQPNAELRQPPGGAGLKRSLWLPDAGAGELGLPSVGGNVLWLWQDFAEIAREK